MRLPLILLFSLFITPLSEAISIQNPLKPGSVRVRIGDTEMTLTRSTSCKQSRHKWSDVDACACCLIKRGIRKKQYEFGGKPYVDYCLKKKHCKPLHIVTLAREMGRDDIVSLDSNFPYEGFLWHLVNNRFVTPNAQKKSGWFSSIRNVFKWRRRDTQNYSPEATRSSADAPPRYDLVAQGEQGLFQLLYAERDFGGFGRLISPVIIKRKAYAYVVISPKSVRSIEPSAVYFKARNIKKATRGPAVEKILGKLRQNGVIGNTGIQASANNTLLVSRFRD